MNCDEAVLSRALGGVSKAQAMAIAERYRQKYDADLVHRISERTGGNYRNALVAWISNPDPSNGLEDQIDSGEQHLIPESIAAVKVSCFLITCGKDVHIPFSYLIWFICYCIYDTHHPHI